jgi:hypothetical protein
MAMIDDLLALFQALHTKFREVEDAMTAVRRTIPPDNRNKQRMSAAQNLQWEINFIAAKAKTFERDYGEPL